MALHAIVANEPVLLDEISGASGKHSLSMEISSGMGSRAFAPTMSRVSVALSLPGDRVDVMLTRTAANQPSDADHLGFWQKMFLFWGWINPATTTLTHP